MKYAMWVCCIVMLLPVAFLIVGGGTIAGMGGYAVALAPLALCSGAHFVLMRSLGRSRHGDTAKVEHPAEDGDSADRLVLLPSKASQRAT